MRALQRDGLRAVGHERPVINLYAGSCFTCGEWVTDGQGRVTRDGDAWRVLCRDCATSMELGHVVHVHAGQVLCGSCQLYKRRHLINRDGVCVDCQ